MHTIYLDHAATTPLSLAARTAMLAADTFGNPSSAHAAGRQARRLLDDARDRVAALLGAQPPEVIFTSGATEANNLAVLGLGSGERGASAPWWSDAQAGSGPPLAVALSSHLEHPCVVEPLRHLERLGVGVGWLPVSPAGVVEPETLLARLTPHTRFVSLMLANHETGAVQPVRRVVESLPKGVLVHTDAAQAVGKLPVNFRDLGVSALTASAHKFGGPVGAGVLLLKSGTPLAPRAFGGHQQRGHRSGTESVMLGVGLAAALEVAVTELAANTDKVLSLRTAFLAKLAGVEHVVNGSGKHLPHILNVSFPGRRSEVLLMALDLAGVACSTGSACSSGSLLASPVLEAMGVPPEVLASAMRFSFSPVQRVAEVEDAGERVAGCVRRLSGEPAT
jgi:cysteine desulfurase